MGEVPRAPYPDFLSGVDVFEGATHLLARGPFIDYCMSFVDPSLGDWAEFGVRSGASARRLLQALPPGKALHLFDSWRGLPEKWSIGPKTSQRKGKGDMGGRPPQDLSEDARTTVHIGRFEDTLPARELGALSLVHLDADLYSSTLTALRGVDAFVAPGTVLIFDEIVGYANWREGEYKALKEWGRPVEWVARTNHLQAACIVRE